MKKLPGAGQKWTGSSTLVGTPDGSATLVSSYLFNVISELDLESHLQVVLG